MAAFNGLITLPANTWVEIADSGLDALSFQTRSGVEIFIGASTSTSAPSGDVSANPRYLAREGMGEIGLDAAAMFAGVGTVATVWAYSVGQDAKIWVSHA